MESRPTFGMHRVCSCQKGEMTIEDRRRRQRELRLAKKAGMPAPKMVRGVDCRRCGGTGYVEA